MVIEQGISPSPEDTPAHKRTCPVCGEEAVRTAIHAHAFRYGTGKRAADLTVNVPIRSCSKCDFSYLDAEAEEIKHDAVCRYLGVLTPRQIRSIRKGHGMTRTEFAKATGLGEATLGRWENGQIVQNIGNDRYLRLLADPGTMQRLRHLTSEKELPPTPVTSTVLQFRRLKITPQVRHQESVFQLRRTA